MTTTAHPVHPPTSTTVDPLLAEDPGLHDSFGLFTTADAMRAGVTPDALRWRRRRRVVTRLRHDVFITTERLDAAAEDPVATARISAAAVMRGTRSTGVVIARRSAARLHGLPLIHRDPAQLELIVPRRQRGGIIDVAASAPRRPLHAQHRAAVHGLPVTSLLRTAVDVAGMTTRAEASAVADAALARCGGSAADLVAVAHEAIAVPRRDLLTFLATTDGRSVDAAASVVRRAVLDAGIALDGVAVPITLRSGRVGVAPLVWPAARVAAVAAEDRATVSALRGLGWRVATYRRDAVWNGQQTAAELAGLLADARPRPVAPPHHVRAA